MGFGLWDGSAKSWADVQATLACSGSGDRRRHRIPSRDTVWLALDGAGLRAWASSSAG
jgi:hypothetical protein